MNNSQIQNIAISCEENEQGVVVYQAHVFMAPPDFRVIKLDVCRTQEAAQKSAEDFLKLLGSARSFAVSRSPRNKLARAAIDAGGERSHMNSRDFCFWLQGMFELTEPKSLDEKQVELIRRHLQMVFIHEIDPSFPSEQQQLLNQAHGNQNIPTNHGIPTEPGARC